MERLLNNFWTTIPKPILCLAPMAGITDSAFRLICKQEGADVVYSEMASVAALFYKPQKTLDLLRFSKQEHPYVVQLFGKDPKQFIKATQIISQKNIPLLSYSKRNDKEKLTIKKNPLKKFTPSGIDINFGCPAKKVFRNGAGASLMTKPKLAKEIICAVVENTTLPVSFKIRTAVETPEKTYYLLDFLEKIEINKLKISAIMIHGRSYKQGFSGPLDIKTIKEVKKYFSGIVIANGSIKNFQEGLRVLQETEADGLGIATGTLGNPELFQNLQTIKTPNRLSQKLTVKETALPLLEKIRIAKQHAFYAFSLKERKGILEMRKHLLWYLKGFPNIKKLRPAIITIKSIEDVQNVLKEAKKLCTRLPLKSKNL